VVQRPDGTTIRHETQSCRRTALLKQELLPELLLISGTSETYYCAHQFRINWLEYLLRQLNDTHHQLLREQRTVEQRMDYEV
jgi:hypothetical protein